MEMKNCFFHTIVILALASSAPKSASKREKVCVDKTGWVDYEGFTCADYVQEHWCRNCMYGTHWKSTWEGLNEALESCCESCGCGEKENPDCVDDPSWMDANKYTCNDYHAFELSCVPGTYYYTDSYYHLRSSKSGVHVSEGCCETCKTSAPTTSAPIIPTSMPTSLPTLATDGKITVNAYSYKDIAVAIDDVTKKDYISSLLVRVKSKYIEWARLDGRESIIIEGAAGEAGTKTVLDSKGKSRFFMYTGAPLVLKI